MRVYHDFFWYFDPDQRFLKWIRIRPNDTDRTGSETLLMYNQCLYFCRSLANRGELLPVYNQAKAKSEAVEQAKQEKA